MLLFNNPTIWWIGYMFLSIIMIILGGFYVYSELSYIKNEKHEDDK